MPYYGESRNSVLKRALRVLVAMQSTRIGLTAYELAAIAGCGVRTVWRCVNSLEEVGVPIERIIPEDIHKRWRFKVKVDKLGRIHWRVKEEDNVVRRNRSRKAGRTRSS